MEKMVCICETGVRSRNTVGHINDAGGYCCPHHGNTCGNHSHFNAGKEQDEWLEDMKEYGFKI